MKMITMVFVMGLAFCISFSSIGYAGMAKEGTAEYSAAFNSTSKVLAMEKERLQINFEGLGVVVTAPPECPLHKASYQFLGSAHVINGSSKNNGFLVWTRPNGEKVYATFESSGQMKGSTKGIATFIGGDGSCKGIEGGVEYTAIAVHPSAKGTAQKIIKAKVHWKIP